jgi:hypothetical protein
MLSVFQRFPALPVRADPHSLVLQDLGELSAGKLALLAGVEEQEFSFV